MAAAMYALMFALLVHPVASLVVRNVPLHRRCAAPFRRFLSQRGAPSPSPPHIARPRLPRAGAHHPALPLRPGVAGDVCACAACCAPAAAAPLGPFFPRSPAPAHTWRPPFPYRPPAGGLLPVPGELHPQLGGGHAGAGPCAPLRVGRVLLPHALVRGGSRGAARGDARARGLGAARVRGRRVGAERRGQPRLRGGGGAAHRGPRVPHQPVWRAPALFLAAGPLWACRGHAQPRRGRGLRGAGDQPHRPQREGRAEGARRAGVLVGALRRRRQQLHPHPRAALALLRAPRL